MSPREAAINSRFRLVQLKILHRSYMSGTTLATIGARPDAMCLRGCRQLATFYHMIWECPTLRSIWDESTRHIQQALGRKLHLTPSLGLLNIWPPTDLTEIEQQLITLSYALVKREIARHWGVTTPPLSSVWLKEIDKCMMMEVEVYETRGCPRKWDAKWGKWNIYRGNPCISPSVQLEMTRSSANDVSSWFVICELLTPFKYYLLCFVPYACELSKKFNKYMFKRHIIS